MMNMHFLNEEKCVNSVYSNKVSDFFLLDAKIMG